MDTPTSSANVKPVPEGYPIVTPYLSIREAARAIDFYITAFGARERMRMASPDGRIMHAEIEIAGGLLMLADECPEMSFRSLPRARRVAGDVAFLCRRCRCAGDSGGGRRSQNPASGANPILRRPLGFSRRSVRASLGFCYTCRRRVARRDTTSLGCNVCRWGALCLSWLPVRHSHSQSDST